MFIHRYRISQLPVDTTNTKISSRVVILTVRVKLVERKVNAHVGMVIVMKPMAERRILGSITSTLYAIPAGGAVDEVALVAVGVIEEAMLVTLPTTSGKEAAIGDVMSVLWRRRPHGKKVGETHLDTSSILKTLRSIDNVVTIDLYKHVKVCTNERPTDCTLHVPQTNQRQAFLRLQMLLQFQES